MSGPAGRLPSTELALRTHTQLHSGRSHAHPYATPVREGRATGSLSPLAESSFHALQSSRHRSSHGGSALELHNVGSRSYEGSQTWAFESRGGLDDGAFATSASLPPLNSPVDSHSSLTHLTSDRGLDSRYPLYNPPNIAHSSQLPASSRPTRLELERSLVQFKLEHRRAEVYQFAELNTDSKLNGIFMQLMRLEDVCAKMETSNSSVSDQLKHIEENFQEAWKPSKAQLTLIRSLIRHYLVKPLSSYENISDLAKNYIKENPDKLRLGKLYNEDNTIRVTVNTEVNHIVGQLKSTFRKAIFSACNHQIRPESFARKMLNKYHLPKVPTDTPVSLLGTLAMMRRIAEPLAKEARNKKGKRRGGGGGDTGFWSSVEEELDRLYKEIKTDDRDKDGWLEWANSEIADDHKRFANRRSGRSSRRSDVLPLDEPNVSVPATFGGRVDGSLTPRSRSRSLSPARDDAEMQNGSGDEDDDDDNVDMSMIGDMASTVTYS